MMRHMLMDPAFPDIVCQWAVEVQDWPAVCGCESADEEDLLPSDLSDPLLTRLAELEVAATRLW